LHQSSDAARFFWIEGRKWKDQVFHATGHILKLAEIVAADVQLSSTLDTQMAMRKNYRYLFNVLDSIFKAGKEDTRSSLREACNLVSDTLHADCTEIFFYDDQRDALVSESQSNQELSRKHELSGLGVQPLHDGGRVVSVFKSGKLFQEGNLEGDSHELSAVKRQIDVRSQIDAPLELGGCRRGVLAVMSRHENHFSKEDVRLVQIIARWVSLVIRQTQTTESISRASVEHGRQIAAEELVTILAHELHNYQSPLQIRIETMLARARDEQRPRDVRDLERTMVYLHRLDTMISELLDLARIDNGVFVVTPKKESIASIVKEVVQSFEAHHAPIHSKIETDFIAPVDKNKLKQCLESIVANAMKYTTAQAPVELCLTRQSRDNANFVHISVSNAGATINPHLIPKIFDRYVVGEDPKRGLGLGLYLAKQIAEAHGGDIEVESKPGQRTKFVVSIPYDASSIGNCHATKPPEATVATPD
jgi:signal transduction histidine kinase